MLVFEKHIHLFIRLIRTSLREPRSFVLPCSIGAGTRGRARNERGNDCIFVCFFFVVVCFPHSGVSCVSFYSHYRQSKLCFLPRNCIFLYFFYFFFRLKFSKTPFHVVLSKNKTNTKKKISFLIINFCFFPQFTDFSSVHKCEPFTPKANGSRVCFSYFLGWLSLFSFFFSRFFLYFVTKIYFSALTVLLLTPFFAYYFHHHSHCVSVCAGR